MSTRITGWLLLAGLVVGAAVDLMFFHRNGVLQTARGADHPTSAPAVSEREIRVMVDNFKFSPGELSVPVGATVTWVNHDDVPHTVTSAATPRVFDSKALDTDDKYSFTFTRPGTYRYYCKIHTHMTGTVIVK